jgi:hypothetical protein
VIADQPRPHVIARCGRTDGPTRAEWEQRFPLPLWEGVRGRGEPWAGLVCTSPPPNPLPQGEGEPLRSTLVNDPVVSPRVVNQPLMHAADFHRLNRANEDIMRAHFDDL